MAFSRPFGDGSVPLPARRRCSSAGEHHSPRTHVGWHAGGGSCLTSDTRLVMDRSCYVVISGAGKSFLLPASPKEFDTTTDLPRAGQGTFNVDQAFRQNTDRDKKRNPELSVLRVVGFAFYTD